MEVCYALVSRSPVVLVMSEPRNANVSKELTAMLSNIPTELPTKVSYTADRYTYHVLVENNLIFLCYATAEFDKKLAYSLLLEMKDTFCGRHDLFYRANMAKAFEFQQSFGNVVTTLVSQYNQIAHDRNSNKVDALRAQVAEVREIMVDNVERVLQRGERLDDLMDKSAELEQTSSSFRSTSRHLRRHMCLRNVRCTVIIVVSVLVVLTIIILVGLYEGGVLTHSNSGKTTSKPNSNNG